MSPRLQIASFELVRTHYPTIKKAPFDIPITQEALDAIASSIGVRPPETGGKLFSPIAAFGIDRFEFDCLGSAASTVGVYRPSATWGTERSAHHIEQPEPNTRVWIGDVHSHPGAMGHPSSAAGYAKGDLGFAEAVLEQNPHLDFYVMPIVARSRMGDTLLLYSWVVIRGNPHRLMYAPMFVAERALFGEWPELSTVGALPTSKSRYYARLDALVSKDFATKRIAVVGCGAGSDLVLKLARMGPAALTLIDYDVVESENLTRTAYTIDDLGMLKVDALKHVVLRTNPFVSVTALAADVTELSETDLAVLFRGHDLIIAGTDSFAAQSRLNVVGQWLKIPTIFIGVHEGARGGVVVGSIPGETGCLRCALPVRYEAAAAGGVTVVDLPGARGLMVDIAAIDAVAVKLALAILERGQPTPMGEIISLLKGRTMIIVRTSPRYRFEGGLDFWHDAVFADLPIEPKDYRAELEAEVFFAMDTAWLLNTPNPMCPDCGTPAVLGVAHG